MGQYTARQLQVAAGITPVTHDQRRARYYITRKKMGLGNAQLYTEDEVFRTAVLAECVALGLAAGTAFVHVTDRPLMFFGKGPSYLVIPGDDRKNLPAKEKREYIAEHGGATVIELEPIERRVQAALKSTTTATECGNHSYRSWPESRRPRSRCVNVANS